MLRHEGAMPRLFTIPLVLTGETGGGYTVTSPVLPELVAEGDTAQAAVRNAGEALAAVFELYEYSRRPFPATRSARTEDGPVSFHGTLVLP
jgi:antitoxin HicB